MVLSFISESALGGQFPPRFSVYDLLYIVQLRLTRLIFVSLSAFSQCVACRLFRQLRLTIL